MQEDELNAIEARAAAATEGPWTFDCYNHLNPSHSVSGPMHVWHRAVAFEIRREEDAAFIASARSDVPALVAEIRRLMAKVEAFERG